jgi:Xaa-Pro aminopeptidase
VLAALDVEVREAEDALVRFLTFLDLGGFQDEVQAAEELEACRKSSRRWVAGSRLAWEFTIPDSYLGPSFETISSIGPNGAIIHYKPKKESSGTEGNVFLVDSGGQCVARRGRALLLTGAGTRAARRTRRARCG